MGALEKARRTLTRRLPPGARHEVGAWLGRRGAALATRYTGNEWVPLDYVSQPFLKLDYPPTARNDPRWLPHRSLEARIAERDDAYAASLETIRGYRNEFSGIPVTTSDESEPSWVNGWQPGLDSSALYSFVRSRSPALYLEIGSGSSTKFVRCAISDGGLGTQLVSVDPHPRGPIDQLCDRVIRSPLEETDLAVAAELRAGDILFFDGSHRTFMNSDATVFFLELLPTMPAGVLVGIHDIYLPFDYPHSVADRYYSEQYLLAAYLLAGTERFETILPAWYVSQTERFRPLIESLWDHDPGLREVARHGTAYWIETR